MTLWTVDLQAPLSMGFSRQEYWIGFPCPPPGGLPKPGIEPTSLISPALIGGFFTTSTIGERRTAVWLNLNTRKAGGYGVVSQEEKGTSLVKIHTYPAAVYTNVIAQCLVVCLVSWALDGCIPPAEEASLVDV